MTLPITILKNVLSFNLMHIEKCEMTTATVQAYGETHEQTQVIVHARPYKRTQGRCPVCRKKCAMNGHKREGESRWRAPNLNGAPVYILYRPQRILCSEHGALNEYIPWADGTSRFTPAFNDEVAWLVCQMNKTAICDYMGINWRTVGNCVKASQGRLEPDVGIRLHDGVVRICVDETGYKKGHKYITVVYDMDRNRVIWVHEDHGLSVFEEFCKLLTKEDRERIEVVAGDGAQWIDACMKYFPNAKRCIDFFHVVQWANKALDSVRANASAKATREYNRLRSEYAKAEAEASAAEEDARRKYEEAVFTLSMMPGRGRPSAFRRKLAAFVEEYETVHAGTRDAGGTGDAGGDGGAGKAGRRKKGRLTPEHEEALKKLSDKAEALKGAKHALGHNPENCTDGQAAKIALIQNDYPDVYLAYQLKESLRLILHMGDPDQAGVELEKWISDAMDSGLKPMEDLAAKIKDRHRANILNAIRLHANSSRSEATNTTIKALIRLARGFRCIENLIALVYLKCSDIVVPLCNRPQPSAEYLSRKRERDNELRRLRDERRRAGAAS